MVSIYSTTKCFSKYQIFSKAVVPIYIYSHQQFLSSSTFGIATLHTVILLKLSILIIIPNNLQV